MVRSHYSQIAFDIFVFNNLWPALGLGRNYTMFTAITPWGGMQVGGVEVCHIIQIRNKTGQGTKVLSMS